MMPAVTALVAIVPRIPLGEWCEDAFRWMDANLAAFFALIRSLIQGAIDALDYILVTPNPLIMVVLFALLAYLAKGWRFGVGALLGMLLIISMGQWVAAMQTLNLVLVATVVAVALAVPIGVLAAQNKRVSSIVRPILDLMQTMPALVWLIPVVTLFRIGYVPGVIATIIFAIPPGIRLTELGIRQVNAEVVEAGHAFGATPRQILREIQLPLALPTIMAGINQVIMLALSMAVIAGLVGAQGLGGQVVSAIATLNLALGFEAGLSVVVLAIYLDRLTGSIGQGEPGDAPSLPKRLWARVRGSATKSEVPARDDKGQPVKPEIKPATVQ